MSIAQSLADMQTTLTYISGVVEERNQKTDNHRLDDIGQNTLDIIARMKVISASINTMTEDVLTKHADILEDSSVMTKESLQNLIKNIEDNETLQQQVHEEIQDIYTKFEDSVVVVLDQMTDDKKQHHSKIDHVDTSIQSVHTGIQDIDKKILSKEDMQEILSDLNGKLEQVLNADKEADEKNQALLHSLNETLDQTQETLNESVSELTTVKDQHTESSSRLSLIETKMEAMSKHVIGEQ